MAYDFCVGLTCANVLCPPRKFCIMNKGRPECVCPKVCPGKDSPVCGTDNKTYRNDCELVKKACQTNTNILLLHLGKCGESDRHK